MIGSRPRGNGSEKIEQEDVMRRRTNGNGGRSRVTEPDPWILLPETHRHHRCRKDQASPFSPATLLLMPLPCQPPRLGWFCRDREKLGRIDSRCTLL